MNNPNIETLKSSISISEVVSKYVELRRLGRELSGLCPFHAEKTPSFTVNEEKSVWYCFGCANGGDVIAFVEKIEEVNFKDALSYLGLESPPRRTWKSQAAKDGAKEIVDWALNIGDRVGEKLRTIGQTQRLLAEFTDKELANWEIKSLRRQWDLLVVIDDDLADPVCMIQLWEHRDIVEGLLSL